MGDLCYFSGRQLILALIIIFHDGNYDQVTINVGPFFSKRDIEAWEDKFLLVIDGVVKSSPEIDECELNYRIIDDYDPINDAVIDPEDNQREIARKYLLYA